MRFGILGGVEILSAQGESLAVGGPRQRALLALLLLDAGRVVPVERLLDGLYGDQPPSGATAALQSQVSRLRRTLPDGLVELHPAGYRIAVDPDSVDVHRFERLASAGARALAEGDPAAAASALGQALALWRGPAAAVGDAASARLDELRHAATEDLFDAQLALGRHTAVIPELRAHIGEHPLRERPRGQLMLALRAAGRPAEALAEFDNARRTLADELGADPSAELADIHMTVLRGGHRGGEPRTSSNIPAQLTSFVGRAPELERIAELLRATRLVTITGPGGAGKTRLAVEASRVLPAQQAVETCFLDLAALTHGADIPQTVLAALGVRDAGLLRAAGHDPVNRVIAALADRSVLLVMDNCEHLIADAATLAHRLLAACPGVRILATSREALAITGEHLCPLPSLPDAAAMQLFADRAAAVSPGFRVTERNSDAVRRICAALDGIPLAIELAAARLRALEITEIAARLDDRFALLSRGERTAAPRHRTLRAAVEWSWDLLAPAERLLAARLTVFTGGATLAAAEQVCAVPDTADLVAGLVDKSLVENTGGRYRMLDTIRAFCAEHLTEPPGRASKPPSAIAGPDAVPDATAGTAKDNQYSRRPRGGARNRPTEARLRPPAGADSHRTGTSRHDLDAAHARYFHALAEQASPHLRGGEQLEWLDRLDADRGNVHAALRWAVANDTTLALRMIGAFSLYWYLRGLRSHVAPLATDLLARIGTHPPSDLDEEYVLCVLQAAWGRLDAAQWQDHLKHAEEFMTTPRGAIRRPHSAFLWAAATGPPKGEPVRPLLDDDLWAEAFTTLGTAMLNFFDGEIDEGEAKMRRALADFRQTGDRFGMVLALDALATIADNRGDRQTFVAAITEAMDLVGQLGSIDDTVSLLCSRAENLARGGELDLARADYEQALTLARRNGTVENLALAYCGLGEIARFDGDLAAARRLQELALSKCTTGPFGLHEYRARVLIALARLTELEGDIDAARQRYDEAIRAAIASRSLPVVARAAAGLAGMASRDGDGWLAALLLGAGAAIKGMPFAGDPEIAALIADVRAAIGGESFDDAFGRGARMSQAEALDMIGARRQRDRQRLVGGR
nr:BTAD domain-containing putative transcriptional regulator [Kibdelosporangium sp. MJ126-NF4]CEL20497.1 Signal transduction response regulator / Disease resistance domain-containing protein [Kibdelosporangium sp. MJ126-NF4]CTQ97721.1 Signal transduction response regulator / Disease resistance domain-containing protein [Kibdelosporangium sp. MJ126-NF4]